MNLSICIITKNEEQNIDRCLKALAPYGLETIVVDTGSTDRTKQIAARYTDRLYDFPWCDDFSAAKNFAIEKTSHSYVLILDSDEFVEQLDLSALEKQIAAHSGAVGRISAGGMCFTETGRNRRTGSGSTAYSQKNIFTTRAGSMSR